MTAPRKHNWPSLVSLVLLGALSWWWFGRDQMPVAGCADAGVVQTVTDLVNKNMHHPDKDNGVYFSFLSNVVGDHAIISAITTTQIGTPLSGRTCEAFASGVKKDGSLYDKSVEHISLEYTIQPEDKDPRYYIVSLKRF